MTLPLDFRPLVEEAERLAREFNDAQTIGRWTDTGVRHGTDAFARLLADPTRRDSQAWMAEYIAERLPMRGWTWGRVIDVTHHEEKRTMLLRCCRVTGTPTGPADVLVACCVALHAREVGS
jgi:hypothetical protein